jgi:hypothetical protein
MKMGSVGAILVLCLVTGPALCEPEQFILFNTSADEWPDLFARIQTDFPSSPTSGVQAGVGAIFSYLHQSREALLADLRRFMQYAEDTGTPIVVQLDGENWWGGRPDLWNWWDPARPGYDPANRANVEWDGWGPEHAIKIAWRNWGRQLRVDPPPNLMSPRYREACRQELEIIVPIILEWWRGLPPEKRYLLVGIKAGWESSIGTSAWYYPNGNDLLDKPEDEDPTYSLAADQPPARGVALTGYAAVSTAGLKTSGELTEEDQAEIVRRHLADLCLEQARLGVPRDKLFTHVAGWKEGEVLYQAGLNPDSCPGWSFYTHAEDPGKDTGVQEALKLSDAPYWAAVEWLLFGPLERARWRDVIGRYFADPRCRYLCIYNWSAVREWPQPLEAIRDICAGTPG